MKKNIVVITSAGSLVIIFFLAGMAISQAIALPKDKPASVPSNPASACYEQGFAAGMEKAEQLVKASGLIRPTPDRIVTLEGKTKSEDANNRRLIINNLRTVIPNPLDPQGPSERTVILTDQTKITQNDRLAKIEISQTLAQFFSYIRDQKFTPRSSAADGLWITVTAADDIRFAETVTATEISYDRAGTVIDLLNR